MNSAFSVLPVEARREQRLAYRSFLAARDGAVDIERRTLSRREERMHRFLTPAASTREIDRALFDERYARYDARRETSHFLDLLRVAREVLRDLPEVRDAVEERLIDVIIDEVGHVSYNRLCLGSLGLAQARMICPIVAAGLGDVVPEFRSLGLRLGTNVDRPLFERDLPEQVRREAFFA
jgi:hypothetical protein